jgi:hypothetical protein
MNFVQWTAVSIKSDAEFEKMRVIGGIVGRALRVMADNLRAGMTTGESHQHSSPLWQPHRHDSDCSVSRRGAPAGSGLWLWNPRRFRQWRRNRATPGCWHCWHAGKSSPGWWIFADTLAARRHGRRSAGADQFEAGVIRLLSTGILIDGGWCAQ